MTDDLYKQVPLKTVPALLLCRVVLICLIGTLGIVMLTIYGPKDTNQQVITILLGFLSAAIVGLLGLAKSQQNAYMIENHVDTVNTKLDSISTTTRIAAQRADNAARVAAEGLNKTSQTLEVISHQSDQNA